MEVGSSAPTAFDHKHYVPLLKAKQGEYGALEDLPPNVKDAMTPLLEVAPVPWDWDTDTAAKTIDSHLQSLAANISRAWGSGRSFFVDTLYLDDADRLADGRSSVAAVMDDCRSAGLLAIGVTGPSRSATHQADVAAAALQDGRGVSIRVVQDDLADLLQLDEALDSLLATLGIGRSDADLVIDFEHIADNQVPTVTLAATAVLAALSGIADWRTVTAAFGAFPENLSGFGANSVTQKPRADWATWLALVARRENLPRLPTFGDYAITGTQLTEIDPRVMLMSANLRYTTDAEWTILKGRNVRNYGYGQFNDLCRLLVGRPEFKGAGFSAGDTYINGCANGTDGPGNATSWRRCATNHHLAFVVDQIANLPGL